MDTKGVFKCELPHTMLGTAKEDTMRTERGPWSCVGMGSASEDYYDSKKTAKCHQAYH